MRLPRSLPGSYDRATFLARSALVLLGAASAGAAPSPPWKGRKSSRVKRWDVITVGSLARNRYWGESEAKPLRSTLCTCTVVQGEGFRLIVDPSESNGEDMARELDRRTGLKRREITAAFVTHEHGDHWWGLAHFPEARWLAAPDVAAALNKTGRLPKPVEGASGLLWDAVDVLPTPGHTLSHHSLRFDCDGLSVVTAGDAVPTRDFWQERRGYFNSADLELSARTMDRIAGLADLVVPGHDNYFLSVTP